MEFVFTYVVRSTLQKLIKKLIK